MCRPLHLRGCSFPQGKRHRSCDVEILHCHNALEDKGRCSHLLPRLFAPNARLRILHCKRL